MDHDWKMFESYLSVIICKYRRDWSPKDTFLWDWGSKCDWGFRCTPRVLRRWKALNMALEASAMPCDPHPTHPWFKQTSCSVTKLCAYREAIRGTNICLFLSVQMQQMWLALYSIFLKAISRLWLRLHVWEPCLCGLFLKVGGDSDSGGPAQWCGLGVIHGGLPKAFRGVPKHAVLCVTSLLFKRARVILLLFCYLQLNSGSDADALWLYGPITLSLHSLPNEMASVEQSIKVQNG